MKMKRNNFIFIAFLLLSSRVFAIDLFRQDTIHIEIKCDYKGKKVEFYEGVSIEFYVDNKLVAIERDSTGFFLPNNIDRNKVAVCFKYKNKQYLFSHVYPRFLKGIWQLNIPKSFFNGGGIYKFYVKLNVPDDETYYYFVYRNKISYYLDRINDKFGNFLKINNKIWIKS